MLLYKTILGERPQGKPNVFFSCHKDDFQKYFEEFSARILRIQDCAIWYESEPEAAYDREELEMNLSQMQLFVMPVTTKYLTTPNRAMDVEFPIAMEKHIPVLPLMMESGLDDVFSKRCGDLQYLNPYNTDETKRDFNEVLESYIRSVLVSDDLAERVRAAFDAYIFLSYRKKDRKKAQELMRLIHRSPLCRDIAIWYDEFLVPGENFNQAIEKMLEKSSLFALVVTPNLVNEINYVMTTEYPVARKQEKPVLPVEMEETDRGELEEHYEALPSCVRGEDGEEFRKALLEKLKGMAVSENDKDPAHNFLIGLAFLDGIDVEVDSQRAEELILGAARAGVPEAISHLIMMKETGKGTERDYKEGVRWREKQVALLREKYESEPNESAACDLIKSLRDLGDAQYELRMLDPAEEAYHEMCICTEKYAVCGNRQFSRFLSISYDKLGGIAQARGNLAQAQEYYEKSYAIDEELTKETAALELRRNLSISCEKLGDVAKARGDLAQAQEYYERCHTIDEELAKETGTVQSRRDLSLSYIDLGDIAVEKRDFVPALEYYEKCLAISEELAKETGAVQSHRDLSVSYEKLGGVAKMRGDLAQAQEYYEKSLAIGEKLEMETGTVQSRRDLSASYNSLGGIAEARGDLAQAQEYYEKCYSIDEELAKETGTVQSRRDLSLDYNDLGYIAEARGNLTQAQEYYEKGLEIYEELAKETGTIESRQDLSVSYEQLGGVAEVRRDLVQAQEYYEKGLAIREELAMETETVQSRRLLSVSYERLGDVAVERRDLAKAEEYYSKGFAIREELAKETGTIRSRLDLSVSYDRFGRIAEEKRNLVQAQEYYEKGLIIREELAGEMETLEFRRDLTVSYIKLGGITEAMGDLAKADEYYEKSLAISEELAKETGMLESRRDLFISYEKLGGIAKARGDLAQAVEYYEKGLAISEGLAKEMGTLESRQDLFISYEKLGGIAEARGNLVQAQECYEKGLAIREELAMETGSLQAYRNLVASCLNCGAFYYKYTNSQDKARTMFERVLEIGKDSNDGYLSASSRKARTVLDRYFKGNAE